MPLGTPRDDVERACQHYGITEAEYCVDPSAYPLPARGTGLLWNPLDGGGLAIGDTTISWGWIVAGILALLILLRRK